MKTDLTAKLKRLYRHTGYRFRRYLLPKRYRFEYEFFEGVRGRSYSDGSFMEMSLRKAAHALDKTLVFERFKERKTIYELVKQILKKVQQLPGHDISTVKWSEKVLDEYQKRLAGREPSNNGFLQLDDKASVLLKEIVQSRRSIRSFKPDSISEELLYEILRAGLWSPTGCNRQGVEYLVLEDREDIRFCQRIAGEGYSFPREAPFNVVVLIDPRGYALPIQRHMAFLEGGAAVENILLTAHSLGVGSCWLFWDNTDANHRKFVERFCLEPWLLPVAMVCLGYPDKVPGFCPARKDLVKCLHFGKRCFSEKVEEGDIKGGQLAGIFTATGSEGKTQGD